MDKSIKQDSEYSFQSAGNMKANHLANQNKSQDSLLPAMKNPAENTNPLHSSSDRRNSEQVSPLDLVGTLDYIENVNDEHSPTDLGFYSDWTLLQTPGSVNTLTEEDTVTNREDPFNTENSDIDSSPDVGTETFPFLAKDSVNNQFMTLEEGNLGSIGETFFIKPSDFYDPASKWTSEGNAYDESNATSAQSSDLIVSRDIYWQTWNNSGSGVISQVDIRLYLDLVWQTQNGGPDYLRIEITVGGTKCSTTYQVDPNNDGTLLEISLNDLTEPNDGSWSWSDIGNIVVIQNGTADGPNDALSDYEVFEVWGWVYTSLPDYELDFEYSWTAAYYDETTEEVNIYVESAIQSLENLNAWEWNGSAWSSLGSLSENGWNNFTCSYLTSNSYYIKINDSNQASDSTQDSWKIDLITLHVWSPPNYQFDREMGWETAKYDDTYEELCIKTGIVGIEDLNIDVWHSSSWINIATISDAQDNAWINTSISTYLIDSTIEFRFQGTTESSDGSQNTWQIDIALIHTWTPNRQTEIADSSIVNDTTINLRYGDTYQWWLLWNDTDSNNLIEDTSEPYSSAPVYVNLVGSPSNGNHTFQFNATNLGAFSITITLEEPTYLPSRFYLTFNVEKNPTDSSNANPQPYTTQIVPYGAAFTFYFSWLDLNHSLYIPAATIYINETFVRGLSAIGGNYSFSFTAGALGTFGVNITLAKTGYNSLSFFIAFNVIRSPTSIGNSSIADSSLIGLLFEDTYDFWIRWFDNTTDVFIDDDTPTAAGNGSSFLQFTSNPLSGNHTFRFQALEVGTFQVIIVLEDLRHLAVTFTIWFTVTPRNEPIYIRPTIPDSLIRGNVFVIRAYLFQNISELLLLQAVEIPVPNAPINFSIAVLFQNGTPGNFSDTKITNNAGIAEFTISSENTAKIKSFQGINITYAGSGRYSAIHFSLDSAYFPSVLSPSEEIQFPLLDYIEENLLYIAIGSIILLVFGSVSGYKLWSYQAARKRERAVQQNLQEIRLLRMVIIRHRDGVRLFAKSVFAVQDDLAEAIAGMSAAIGSFMQGIASKSLEGTGDVTGTTEFVRMEQKGLHMLQRNGTHTAVIVISEGALGRFTEKNLTELQIAVEEQFQKELAHFFTNEQIPEAQLAKLVNHHLYLGLLDPIRINTVKFQHEERNLSQDERQMVRELLAHRELVPSEILFLDSFLSHLKNRGFSQTAVIQFLLKAYCAGIIEGTTIQEARRPRQ